MQDNYGIFYSGQNSFRKFSNNYDCLFMKHYKFMKEIALDETLDNKLINFGSMMTTLSPQHRRIVIMERLEGQRSFNNVAYSKLQLCSFLLADCSSFWSIYDYEIYTGIFFSIFPYRIYKKVPAQHFSSISTANIVAIMNGILNSFNEVEILAVNNTWDDEHYGHFILFMTVLIDMFVHRITKIEYGLQHGFQLSFVGVEQFRFNRNLPRPQYPVFKGLCMGMIMESSLDFHQAGDYENFGTFGFVAYVSRGVQNNCDLSNCPLVACVYDADKKIETFEQIEYNDLLVFTKMNNLEIGNILQFNYERSLSIDSNDSLQGNTSDMVTPIKRKCCQYDREILTCRSITAEIELARDTQST